MENIGIALFVSLLFFSVLYYIIREAVEKENSKSLIQFNKYKREKDEGE